MKAMVLSVLLSVALVMFGVLLKVGFVDVSFSFNYSNYTEEGDEIDFGVTIEDGDRQET